MSEAIKDTSCAARVEQNLQGHLADLQRLWDVFVAGIEDDELGSLNDYALCFDYMAPGTFDDQLEGYFRYLEV